jgi:aspartate aminotransferase-like enzyme
MSKTAINFVPGPTNVEESVLKAMCKNFGSGDLDRDYLELYNATEKKLQKILGTSNQVIMQTGEGMWGLWGGLKSTIKPGDNVVAVCTGVFGYGIADMAASLGADVARVELPFNETIQDSRKLEEVLERHAPMMITAVHCETPSGTLNPLKVLAEARQKHNIELLCVDTVASAGATPIEADKYMIDLALNGSQKALSAPPSMSFVSVSPKAWEKIEKVNYSGYDAFLPFKNAQKDFYFPNTPYWHGTAALNAAAQLLIDESLEKVYARHTECMLYCIKRLKKMGLELYAAAGATHAPTVTAVRLPDSIKWEEFNNRCKEKGLAIAGNYGKLAGKVFRIGHMGSQAKMDMLKAGLDIIQSVI